MNQVAISYVSLLIFHLFRAILRVTYYPVLWRFYPINCPDVLPTNKV